MMRIFFNPNDWLGQHEGVCLVLLAITVLIGGTPWP
jgi:hypothetical protein